MNIKTINDTYIYVYSGTYWIQSGTGLPVLTVCDLDLRGRAHTLVGKVNIMNPVPMNAHWLVDDHNVPELQTSDEGPAEYACMAANVMAVNVHTHVSCRGNAVLAQVFRRRRGVRERKRVSERE